MERPFTVQRGYMHISYIESLGDGIDDRFYEILNSLDRSCYSHRTYSFECIIKRYMNGVEECVIELCDYKGALLREFVVDRFYKSHFIDDDCSSFNKGIIVADIFDIRKRCIARRGELHIRDINKIENTYVFTYLIGDRDND